MDDLGRTPEALSKLKSTFLDEYPPPYDFDQMYDTGGLVRLDRHPQLYYLQSEYVFKLGGTKYEMNMIHLAGDCAVPVVRGVVQDGEHLGFVMKKENPLGDESRLLSGMAKRRIVYMIEAVVEKLHAEKGIVHGDLKLANMLLCSDGKVRLCDFADATFICHPNPPPPIYTVAWLSPYRSLHPTEPSTVDEMICSLWVLASGNYSRASDRLRV